MALKLHFFLHIHSCVFIPLRIAPNLNMPLKTGDGHVELGKTCETQLIFVESFCSLDDL